MKHWKHVTTLLALAALLLTGCGTKSEQAAQAPNAQNADAAKSQAQPGAGAPAGQQQPASQPLGSPQAAAQQPAAAPVPEPPPPPKTYTMAAGRKLTAVTTSSLSTKTNQLGETFTANLTAPIVSGDWVIAPAGATVQGKIVSSDPGGKVKGVASMAVALTSLTLADGRTIPIQTSAFGIQAKSTKKKDAAKIGIGAGAGALIGAIAGGGKGAAIGAGVGGGGGTALVMSTRGDPAVLPAESRVSFTLAAPVTITEKK